jgi:hypothetical protein
MDQSYGTMGVVTFGLVVSDANPDQIVAFYCDNPSEHAALMHWRHPQNGRVYGGVCGKRQRVEHKVDDDAPYVLEYVGEGSDREAVNFPEPSFQHPFQD